VLSPRIASFPPVFRYVYLKLLKPSLAAGTTKNPINKTKTEIMEAPIMYGLKNRVKEIPELRMAIISVLLANFEVNQIMDKNKKIGNKELAK
jgi:hypothetical protein